MHNNVLNKYALQCLWWHDPFLVFVTSRMLQWNPNFDSVEEVRSPGARGLAYIVFSDESGPLDQTDIDWTVILDALGWWSIIPEICPDWTLEVGGHPQD